MSYIDLHINLVESLCNLAYVHHSKLCLACRQALRSARSCELSTHGNLALPISSTEISSTSVAKLNPSGIPFIPFFHSPAARGWYPPL